MQVGIGVLTCADLLRVSERSIRGWESGETRIPYAAYKLLRVLKSGRYLAHSSWKDYGVQGDVLFTPEGHRFQAGELAWWLLRRADKAGAADRELKLTGYEVFRFGATELLNDQSRADAKAFFVALFKRFGADN